MSQYPVVYENKTTESQSAQRTNGRRRLLPRSKYAILFKYCNKMNFTSLRTLGRESAIGCYIYRLFIYATWGVAKWAKEVQSLDS